MKTTNRLKVELVFGRNGKAVSRIQKRKSRRLRTVPYEQLGKGYFLIKMKEVDRVQAKLGS